MTMRRALLLLLTTTSTAVPMTMPGPAHAEEADDAALLRAFFAADAEARASYEAAARSMGEAPPAVTFRAPGGERQVPLDDFDDVTRALAGSLRAAAEPETVRRLFDLIAPQAAAAGLSVPTREAVARWSTEALRAWNREALWARPDFRPIDLPEVARFDESALSHTPCVGGTPATLGRGADGDLETFQFLDPHCDVSPKGIYALDPREWKSRLGCIKDQGNRGSCVSFAIASALETAYARTHAERLDLSEQGLYARIKLNQPLVDPKRHDDGANTEEALKGLAAGQSIVGFEDHWGYNPSPKRERIPGAPAPYYWENSCSGYDETCSEAAHQAEAVCQPVGQLNLEVCSWQTPEADDGLRVEQSGLQLWDPNDRVASLAAVKTALDAGLEVVLSLMVNNPFKAAVEGDGLVKYGGENVSSFGFHAVHAVAYVDNDTLATFAPDVPPGSAGAVGEGGYLIVRNSWGPCAGDGGYLYLPYRWVKAGIFVSSAIAVGPEDISLVLADP
jgi:hypothetical protein